MVNQEQYSQMVKDASPPTKSYKTIPMAFLIGGFICMLGEIILNIFQHYGFEKTESSAWASVILVLLSALLTGFNVYEKIAKYAGAGTLVPITGFSNAVVSSALEAKTEGFILGVGAKIFTIAGPVILYGIGASFIYGIFYYFFGK